MPAAPRRELAQAELARQQIGADEAQRPGQQEQQVVADQRRDRARAEERRRPVPEQRVREGEAERVGVEGVGVEQVQRVVEHRVPHPGDLPGGAHRVAEVRRDAAGQVQHQRPAREHRQRDPGERRPTAARRVRAWARAPSGRRARAGRGARTCGAAAAAAPSSRARLGDPDGVRGGLGTPVLIGCCGSVLLGSAQHTRAVRRHVDALAAVCPSWRTGVALSGRSGEWICARLSVMRVLVVGAGGVGAAFAAIAQRRPAFERVVAGRRLARARARRWSRGWARPTASRPSAWTPPIAADLRRADRARPARRGAERLRSALQRADLRRLLRRARDLPGHGDDAVPAPSPAPLRAARDDARRPSAGAHEQWEQAGLLALVGIGVEPGLSDVFARYAAEELFSDVREVGVRDGADLVVEGYDFAPTFSIWTTIEECLNPPLIWERERGFYTTAPFSEPEIFDVPRGHRQGRVRQRRARGGRADPALGARASG